MHDLCWQLVCFDVIVCCIDKHWSVHIGQQWRNGQVARRLSRKQKIEGSIPSCASYFATLVFFPFIEFEQKILKQINPPYQ